MTISSRPYDSGSYAQADFAEMFASFLKDGYVRDYEDALEVVAATPVAMKVVVSTGRAIIQGYWYENSDPLELDIAAAHPSLPRYDWIVLRLETGSPRQIAARVLTGTAAASPTLPALTQTSTIWEIGLAYVRVNAGVVSILSSNISDTRDSTTSCGIAASYSTKYSEIVITEDVDLDTNKITSLADPTNAQDCMTKNYFDTNVAAAGFGVNKAEVIPYSGSSVPTGWLECDGSSLLRATYPDLFAAFGTCYGAADGTHFNLPDLRSRFVIGASHTRVGTYGGEKTHVLTEAEMPAHTHTPSRLTSGYNNISGGGKGILTVSSGASGSTGSGTAHNNLHPYIALRYIVRAS